jgi:predicted RNA methylase
MKPIRASETSEGDDCGTTKVERDRIITSIRMRSPISDHLFDRFLEQEVRAVSAMYWTPLAAAVRAGEWLDEVGAETVMDLGSGAGKFCVAAALASKARFIGVEHRKRLVDAARRLARQFEVEDRVSFVHQPLERGLEAPADAYYLYNPFGENLFQRAQQLDDSVELSDRRYLKDVAATERLLEAAATGTHLITFGGFGGLVPRTYEEARVDWTFSSILRMWKKTAGHGGRP